MFLYKFKIKATTKKGCWLDSSQTAEIYETHNSIFRFSESHIWAHKEQLVFSFEC